MSDVVTTKDHYDDTLVISTSDDGENLYLDASEDDEEAQLAFWPSDRGEVRKIRDALNSWLGEKGDLVAASSVSFNEGLMRLAAVHGKTVTFRYAKGKDGAVIETRVLKPESVTQVGDHVTFTGFDPDRDEPRAYRVDRIKGEVSVA